MIPRREQEGGDDGELHRSGSTVLWEYGGNFAGSGKHSHSSASQPRPGSVRATADKTEHRFPNARNSSAYEPLCVCAAPLSTCRFFFYSMATRNGRLTIISKIVLFTMAENSLGKLGGNVLILVGPWWQTIVACYSFILDIVLVSFRSLLENSRNLFESFWFLLFWQCECRFCKTQGDQRVWFLRVCLVTGYVPRYLVKSLFLWWFKSVVMFHMKA